MEKLLIRGGGGGGGGGWGNNFSPKSYRLVGFSTLNNREKHGYGLYG